MPLGLLGKIISNVFFKHLFFIFVFFIICSSAIAFDEKQVIEFAKSYLPYDTSDTLTKIMVMYAVGTFQNPDYKNESTSKISNSEFIVTFYFSVGEPIPEVIKFCSPVAKKEINNVKGILKLEWIVDMNKNQIKPYNYLAEDSLNLYEGIFANVKVILKRRYDR